MGGWGWGGDFAENFLLNKRSCAAFIGRISNVKMSVSTRHPILQKSTVERKKSPHPLLISDLPGGNDAAHSFSTGALLAYFAQPEEARQQT